jgi:hypothetical protein
MQNRLRNTGKPQSAESRLPALPQSAQSQLRAFPHTGIAEPEFLQTISSTTSRYATQREILVTIFCSTLR